MQRLKSLVERLRDPKTGCPWDIEQNSKSIAHYCVEEAHELQQAISLDKKDAIKSELGDLLFQKAFHCNIAEKEFNFIAKRSFSNLTIELEDMNSCFNLNALVKSKNGITEKNDENVLNFLVFLSKSFVNKNSHIELLHRIVDSIDTNNFPETYGAEDLYYISNERLNLASDQNFYHKSQIKDLNLNFLTDADFQKIYGNICALPSHEIKLNINNINFNNQKVFHSIFSDLTVKDIEKIILNKPETGYLNYKDLVDRTSINQIKLKNKYIVFKPIFIKIKYTLQIEEYMFKLISFIDLSNRENNIIYRTISDENIYF